MSTINGRPSSYSEELPSVQEFEGFGELTVGGSIAGENYNKLLFTALALLNHPAVNAFLLANHLKLKDRLTKTVIFPREGMSLPDGEVYIAPQEEVNMENTQ